MTCFWNGVLKSLNKNDFDFINETKKNTPCFIELLKKKIKPMCNVLWQGKTIKEREIREHLQAIKEYNINNISNGHLTSTCDSFLLLICELFQVDIIHHYLKNDIYYKYQGNSRKILHFSSSTGHFVFSR